MSATNRSKRNPKPTARIAGIIGNTHPTFDYKAARKAIEEKRKLVVDKKQDFLEYQNNAPGEDSQGHP